MADNIKFITLRKRNEKLLKDTYNLSKEKWQKIKLPIPKRKHQSFLVHENEAILTGISKPLRQIILKDHGRQQPTYIVTNNTELKLTEVVLVYAKRWNIENKLSELVTFFNLNALSSPLMIRIHFDILWTLVADTLYSRFAQDLPRFEKKKAQTIFRRFVNMPGQIEYNENRFKIKIRKRAYTPILMGVSKLNNSFEVPWLDNQKIEIIWTA